MDAKRLLELIDTDFPPMRLPSREQIKNGHCEGGYYTEKEYDERRVKVDRELR